MMNCHFNPKQWLYLLFILCLIASLIAACTSPPSPTATPYISRDKAIEIVIGGCRTPHLVLVGEPKNIRAKLTTLKLSEESPIDWEEPANRALSTTDPVIWLVQMDGQLQLVGGPPPITKDGQIATETPQQPSWGTCTVRLDAISGEIIDILG
jgi:hypothetical protein